MSNGKNWKLVQSSHQPITLQLAKKFSEMAEVNGERKRDKHKVQRYKRSMVAGTWRPDSNLSSAICKELGSREVRVNGQHTSTSAQESIEEGGIKEGAFNVTVNLYEVETVRDLVNLWQEFDKPDQGRTNSEILHAECENNEKLRTLVCPTTGKMLSETKINKLASALDMVEGDEYTKDIKSRLLALAENLEEAQMVANLVYNEKVSSKFVTTPAVISMCWKSLRHCRAQGWNTEKTWEKYWMPIFFNATGIFPADDPRSSMAKWFLQQDSQPKAQADRKEWKNRIARSYNAWLRGKPMKHSGKSKTMQDFTTKPDWTALDQWPEMPSV